MLEEKIVENVELPAGISARIEGNRVIMKGKIEEKKALKAKGVSFRVEGNNLVIEAKPATRKMTALVRTMRAHIDNMIEGLEKGYTYKLVVVFSHFPMNLQVKDKVVEIKNFVGEKQPRLAKIIGNTKVEVRGKEIFVSGTSKDDVGQTAANLETVTRVIGRDNRVFQDGIFVVEKIAGGEKK